ncbi:uncharacterized protein LOC114371477 [Glycine soja]|uniref:uncharacterized protein LOC114371477 n=1 Tax=Glycine soja TaxID=3848 RepID=UPI00103B2DD4|nr:uncharacterized protein LOC114371477 [Glycine soja]
MQLRSHSSSRWEWSFNWRRPLFDSEVEMANSFIGEILKQQLHPQKEDMWIWKHDSSGHYSKKSGYDLIRREVAGADHTSDFVELWKLKIPAKSVVFAWRIIRDRLPTKSNLRRRQVMLTDTLCPFCRTEEEEATHLFFSCSNILPLWWESLSWVNLTTALPQNPRDHFLQHEIGKNQGKKATRWKCWWIALTRTIWQHRNIIVFQNGSFDGSKLMDVGQVHGEGFCNVDMDQIHGEGFCNTL